ncbi:cathelicidin antimicrobial peptide-like [Leptodactylus fuscus]|uniref:cathelicidin antimicrobial peptide-like n=1 Tax=Leptodactylus fuscus TaxID=238119 RepID=UPI003F4EF006
MMPWKLSLLLLSAVTLHGCLSAHSEVPDGRSRRDIMARYNQREGVTYLYKALEEDEKPDKKDFIIKETECRKSDNPDVSQCDFKSDGDVKLCTLPRGSADIVCTSQKYRFYASD